jgi:hypothetical protein
VAASGFGLAEFVYNRIVGLPHEQELVKFKSGLRLLDPARDFSAYLELRRMGQVSLLGWIRSLAHYQTFPYFAWTDPAPSLARLVRPLRRWLRQRKKKEQPVLQLPAPVTSAANNP